MNCSLKDERRISSRYILVLGSRIYRYITQHDTGRDKKLVLDSDNVKPSYPPTPVIYFQSDCHDVPSQVGNRPKGSTFHRLFGKGRCYK